jgi:heme exporter protein CcmD
MIDFSNKYFIYVWPPIAITAVVLAWTVVDSLIRAQRWKKKAEALEAGDQP